mmetsp:Transcript_74387/g.210115  ORF Transcript_74387/g.210115 Transcript_74387/m.210115 type:complete len:453 (+) Transcript_74387:102-1460(+)
MLWRWQSFLELCSGSGFEDLGAGPDDIKMEGALPYGKDGVYTVLGYSSDAYRERKPLPTLLYNEADGDYGVYGALQKNGAMPVGGQHSSLGGEDAGAGCGVLCPEFAGPMDRCVPRPAVGQHDQAAEGTDRALAITAPDIEASMGLVHANVSAWSPSNFGLVKVRALQDAPRNHGQVDMMRCDGGRGRAVAVKKMPNWWVASGPEEFGRENGDNPEHPWHDLGILRLLNGGRFPFACQLFGVHRDGEHTYVLTSLASEGDLFSWCSGQPSPGREREMSFAPIVKQIFSAMRFLHELGIAHRDLSLENILLNDPGNGELEVKLIDFAQATSARRCRDEVRGKLAYQAPEMHSQQSYDARDADLFSCGVAAYMLVVGAYPWTSTKPGECASFGYARRHGMEAFLRKKRVRGARGGQALPVGQCLSGAAARLVCGLLGAEPEHRRHALAGLLDGA